MPPDPGMLTRALSDALSRRLSDLFGTLCANSDLSVGLPRFERDLNHALEAYDLVSRHLMRM